jgi:hypothetical protein
MAKGKKSMTSKKKLLNFVFFYMVLSITNELTTSDFLDASVMMAQKLEEYNYQEKEIISKEDLLDKEEEQIRKNNSVPLDGVLSFPRNI